MTFEWLKRVLTWRLENSNRNVLSVIVASFALLSTAKNKNMDRWLY